MGQRERFSWLVELVVVAAILCAIIGVASLTGNAMIRHARTRRTRPRTVSLEKRTFHVPAAAAVIPGIWHKQAASGVDSR
jgi:hypothetical protein